MRQSKILLISLVAILGLLMLIAFIGGEGSGSQTTEKAAPLEVVKLRADKKELALFKYQQHELQAAVKSYFDKAIASGEIVGAGVSIIKGDSILLSEGFGKRKSTEEALVDSQTIFRLGSLSKGFTGILAAELKDEGKLSWSDRVSDYIPGFQLGDRKNTESITLANILSHTSGAPYHSFTNLVEAGLPLSEIASRFGTVTPVGSPGTVYSYQNALFALAGEMMYKSTGQEITCLLENKFFKPLGMCSTVMDYQTLAHEDNVAMPHYKRRSGWKPLRLADNYYNAVAAGGINASTRDMAEWMRMLLGYHPEVISKTALQEAFRPFIEIKGHSKYYQRWPGHIASYYGFGWRIHTFTEGGSKKEKTIWHHGGSVNDFRNEIALYPDTDLGICVLFNNNARLARSVIPDLYKIVEQVYEQPTVNIASNSTPQPEPNL